jgi:ABC-2 type transport system permease protein
MNTMIVSEVPRTVNPARTRSALQTFTWLLKCEFWQHRVLLFWVPLFVAACVALFIVATTAFQPLNKVERLSVRAGVESSQTMPSVPFNTSVTTSGLSSDAALKINQTIGLSLLSLLMPLVWTLGVMVSSYATAALFTERVDRSILFWKSLPISDGAVVLSKAVSGLIVAPLVTLAIGIALTGFLAIVLSALASLRGDHTLWGILVNPQFYAALGHCIAMLFVYIVWALPAVGWLIFVSAWSRTIPFVWAILLPMLVGAVVQVVYSVSQSSGSAEWVWRDVVGRLLASVFPGSWFVLQPGGSPNQLIKILPTSDLMSHTFALFESANIWVGAAVGIALIVASVRVRKWRSENLD